MSHGIASVRDSCLKAFLTLLKGSADTGVAKAVLPRQQVYHCSKEQMASGKSQWVRRGRGRGSPVCSSYYSNLFYILLQCLSQVLQSGEE